MSPRRPVSRWRVASVGLAIALMIVGVVALAEVLRHPAPAGPSPGLADDEGDPRLPLDCPEPPPREGGAPTILRGPHPADALVSSGELLDCPAFFDDMTVRYRGEVVGALLRRPGGAWVQLNDDLYAGDLGPLPAHREYRGANAGVGVFLPHEVADQIAWVGGPGARGDVLEVVGAFRRVDPETSEVVVIRAQSGQVLHEGRAITHEPLRDRQVVALVAALVAAGLLALQLRRRSAA